MPPQNAARLIPLLQQYSLFPYRLRKKPIPFNYQYFWRLDSYNPVQHIYVWRIGKRKWYGMPSISVLMVCFWNWEGGMRDVRIFVECGVLMAETSVKMSGVSYTFWPRVTPTRVFYHFLSVHSYMSWITTYVQPTNDYLYRDMKCTYVRELWPLYLRTFVHSHIGKQQGNQ